MSGHAKARPIGGQIFDRPMLVLVALFAASAAVMGYRFFVGLGPVSNMTDGFTWGIWEPVNVVVFTGIGAGALGVGLVTYALNRGEYHVFVRPAVSRLFPVVAVREAGGEAGRSREVARAG